MTILLYKTAVMAILHNKLDYLIIYTSLVLSSPKELISGSKKRSDNLKVPKRYKSF